MDEELRALQRKAFQGDLQARKRYIARLLRGNRLDLLRELLVDQSFHDLTAINEELSIYKNPKIFINVIGDDIIVGDFMYSPPPPPPSLILSSHPPYDYISPLGNYGPVPHSEAAMHGRVAGQNVVRYFLRLYYNVMRVEDRVYDVGGMGSDKLFINHASVQLEDWPRQQIFQGTLGEVLPAQVRRDLGGFGNESLYFKRQLLNNKDIFLAVTAEIRSTTEWSGYTPMRISQLQLYYYPGLDQVYWRIGYSPEENLLEVICDSVKKSLPHAQSTMGAAGF